MYREDLAVERRYATSTPLPAAGVACALLLAPLTPARPAVHAVPVLALAPPGEPGQRLVISARVVDRAGAPIAGAHVHVYQTDSTGQYTRERALDESHARLNGWITCDAAGRFELRSIRPRGYPRALRLGDRERHIPAHIHMDVDASGRTSHRSQVVFAADSLLTDTYWQDWVKKLGQPMLRAKREGGVWRADLRLVLE
jgi:protocatechuate 3,4-dioxygenase beta subunit